MIGLASFLIEPLTELADMAYRLTATYPSATRVARVSNANAELEVSGRLPGPRSNAFDLVFDRVTVGESIEWSASFPAGTVTGIVVLDEAVRQTIVSALNGTRRPLAGSIRAGDIDLGALGPGGARTLILVEPSVPQLFGRSVREALLMNRSCTEAELRLAADAAAIDDLLLHAPGQDPFGKRLLERAANLSGGQRQRVALARALLTHRPILVLEDPTSSVDTVTEQRIAEGLHSSRALPDFTTLIITTSVPLLLRCDRVMLANRNSSLVGSHRDLMAVPEYADAVAR
jgi:putative ABC transport system ATP-binding protein